MNFDADKNAEWDLLKIFAVESKDELLNNFTKGRADLFKMMEVVEQSIRHAKHNGWKNQIVIWNAVGFVLMISMDLKILMEHVIFEKDSWKLLLWMRNFATILYEASDDLPQVFGKVFRDAVIAYGIENSMMQELTDSIRELNKYRNAEDNNLKKIRDVIGAHREHDFLVQIDLMAQLHPYDFVKKGMQFDVIMNEIARSSWSIISNVIERVTKSNGKILS